MEKSNIVKSSNGNNRITGLDVYRIIACMLVIINHNNSKVMFQLEPSSFAWYVTVAVFYVTKIAVPGFLMIAGYNLLHRNDSWEKNFVRVKRIAIDLILFSLFYYIFKCIEGGYFAGITKTPLLVIGNFIKNFIALFLQNKITDAFWYLYMYLGLMIMLPLMQKLANAMDKKDFRIMFVLALIFVSIIPTITEFVPDFKISDYFAMPVISMFGGCAVYMFIGHYFYTELTDRKLSVWPFAGFAAGFILNIVISSIELKLTAGNSYLSVGEIEYVPLMLESISVFAILLRIKYKEVIVKVVNIIAPVTFGIYLLSDFVCANTHFVYFNLCSYMNRLIAVAIQDVVALCGLFVVIYLLRKIPVFKKYI